MLRVFRKETRLGELGCVRIAASQGIDCDVHKQEIVGGGLGDQLGILQIDAAVGAAALPGGLAARTVNQAAPHRLGRSSEEVTAAVLVLDLLDIDQTQVGLMQQGRRR